MVKADLTRDYYGDLECAPGADVADIKKQFKKLALAYHPDRNPGRESEVTAKFQKIQSAHEILIDPQERAKYDANRIRTGRQAGGSSGVRGNPWSNAGAQYPPPPKPPTAQRRAPPPSTGAGRYAKFSTPQGSAYQQAQEGAESRKNTYEAWEHLRHPNKGDTGPGKSWKAPQPPPRGTPQSGRDESNAQKHGPPPKVRPGYDEFREPYSPQHRRSQSSNASHRKGFMPNTPGAGDEPAAPMGAYFTERNKPIVAPDVPPRESVPPREPASRQRVPSSQNSIPDPLRQFRQKPMGNEPRVSTPYQTHGGEKFNPFESANINRSKSTREGSGRFDDDFIPRTGSDSNLNSPNRTRSFAEHKSPKTTKSAFGASVNLDSSSESGSEEYIRMTGRARRQEPKRANGTSSGTSHQDQSDGSARPYTNGQVPQFTQPKPQANGEPSMYANSDSVNSDQKRVPTFFVKLPPVPDAMSSGDRFQQYTPKYDAYSSASQYFTMDGKRPVTPPSGFTSDSQSLNAFEGLQRNLVDQLLSNKQSGGLGKKFYSYSGSAEASRFQTNKKPTHPQSSCGEGWSQYRYIDDPDSPSNNPMVLPRTFHTSASASAVDQSRALYGDNGELRKQQANHSYPLSSFTFNVNDDTFHRTRHQSNGFSNSAENISTKFTPEDWDGKFEAGGEYFKPEGKSRAQSTSRTRGRSPIKVKPVDTRLPPRAEIDTPSESPGGTKFSAEEWKETFKPQTFMPPPTSGRMTPGRKRTTGPTIRPTMGGNAAVVDDGDTSDEKPLFTGRKSAPTMTGSPEPMDVDTPPATHTVPQYVQVPNGHLKVNTESSKRAASSSQSPTDTESLKVNFGDLSIRDLMSTLSIPIPPPAPQLPISSEFERPSRAAYAIYLASYEKYMKEWDLFSSKFLLHMVTRKNQSDTMKDKRWTDERGTEYYRQGLKEDQAVLKRWMEYLDAHEMIVKAFVVVKERMKSREEREGAPIGGDANGDRARPRKKTH